MPLRALTLCLVLAGLLPAAAAHAATAAPQGMAVAATLAPAFSASAQAAAAAVVDDACQRDNLWAEQVLYAEAALPLPRGEDDARCAEAEATEDCNDGPSLSAPRRSPPGRCDVRFGGAPRLHLRAGAARGATAFERLLLGPGSRVQLQQGSEPLAGKGPGLAAPMTCARGPAALAPPAPRAFALSEAQRPLPGGHRLRIDRPPR